MSDGKSIDVNLYIYVYHVCMNVSMVCLRVIYLRNIICMHTTIYTI